MPPTEIAQAIRACRAARAPLNIVGPPGGGKTSVVHAVRDEFQQQDADFQFVGLRANLLEPVDVTGIIFPDHETHVARWYKPDFLPAEGTRGMLFIDEFPQATMAVQCALMKLVDDLPDGWSVVIAGNRTTDRAGAGQVATHVLDRFTHVDFDVSRQDWQRWAATAGIRPEVRGFIDFRPGLLFSFDAADRQRTRAGCSPRSWDRASRIIANTTDEALRFPLLAGTVGEAAAAELAGFLRVFSQCPNPDAILSAPDSTPVPTEPSALFAICAALADRAKSLASPKLESLVRYLSRLPVEFGALLMTDCLSVAPSALMVPSAGKWITDHKDIFANSRK